METEAGKVRVAKTRRRRKEIEREGDRKEIEEGKTEKKKSDKYKKSSRRVGNLRWERRSCKIRGKSKKTGPRKIL